MLRIPGNHGVKFFPPIGCKIETVILPLAYHFKTIRMDLIQLKKHGRIKGMWKGKCEFTGVWTVTKMGQFYYACCDNPSYSDATISGCTTLAEIKDEIQPHRTQAKLAYDYSQKHENE